MLLLLLLSSLTRSCRAAGDIVSPRRLTTAFITTTSGTATRLRLVATMTKNRAPPRASVTGTVYISDDPNAPVVKLFTKDGCTLCNKVKDLLLQVKDQHPHSLQQVDITDPEHAQWFQKYKYDIPVLHLNNQYWAKHRLSTEQIKAAFHALQNGTFQSPRGEPNAAEMENKR